MCGVTCQMQKITALHSLLVLLHLNIDLYSTLLAQVDPPTEANIKKDLRRTLPNKLEFNEPGGSGKNRLYNVLKAYAQYDPQVKYCQGLNYVAAMILLYINKEELAFFTLVHIMYNFDWRQVYTEEMPKLTILIDLFISKLEMYLPKVYNHLRVLEVDISGLFSHVFLSIFIYCTPLSLAVRIFDLFMLEKENALISVAINMLRIMKEKIMTYNSMVM